MSPTDGTVKRCDDGWLRMRWRAHSSRAQRRVRRSTKAVLANSARLCALLKSFPSRYPLPPHGGSMLRSFARTLVSSGMCLLFPLLVQAQASSFSIGTASAAPGRKSTGYLEVPAGVDAATNIRSEEHTSELQSLTNLVCRLLLEKKKIKQHRYR